MKIIVTGADRTHSHKGHRIKIIGNGGHAKVVHDALEHFKHASANVDGKIVRFTEIDACFVAVGDNAARKREAEACAGPWLKIVHPGAHVSPSAQIGDGSIIMAGAIVAAGAVIGRHCIVNHGATVDHDCVIGDYAHIAPGAHLCGGVIVGEGALVGVGVGVAPGANIPAWCLVKAHRIDVCPTK